MLNFSRKSSGVAFFQHIATKSVQRTIVHCSIAIPVLVLVTLACYRLHFNVATAGLLYVIVIIILSRTGDFAASIIASIVAAICLAHLAPPAYSFRVSDPLDDVAIAVFLITAFVVAQLVSDLRRQREEALLSVNRKLIDAEERERCPDCERTARRHLSTPCITRMRHRMPQYRGSPQRQNRRLEAFGTTIQ